MRYSSYSSNTKLTLLLKHLGTFKNDKIQSRLEKIQTNTTLSLDYEYEKYSLQLSKLYNANIKDHKQSNQKHLNVHTYEKVQHKSYPKPDRLEIHNKFTYLKNIYSINKILERHINLGVFLHKKVNYIDNYSLSLFKTLDSKIRNSSDRVYNKLYLKNMKLRCIDIFNKQQYYKKYSYSSKDFKKSDLENTFSMNLSITLPMIKVYANIFGFNIIYKDIDSKYQYLTRFVKENCTVLMVEDNNNIYTLYDKSQMFVRGITLSNILEINKKLDDKNLSKSKLNEIQNIAKMKNIDVKKAGKTGKINKTKQELIDEIIKI
jgi:hypothetical protein